MSALRICVTVKQVPDTAEVRIDPETNSLMREGVPSIVNPEDLNAVETALDLTSRHGGTVTALSMGPPQAETALEEVLAMGVDKAVLLSDRRFAGSDTLVTAFVLSRAILKLGTFDLILCGRQAIDGDTAQVGPQVAGFLGLPQVTYAEAVTLEGERLSVRRGLEDRIEQVGVRLPALVTVSSPINRPRYPSLYNIEQACSGTLLTVWGADDLQVPDSMAGLTASPTGVKRIFQPEKLTDCEHIEGTEEQMANTLVERLRERNIL